MTGLHQCTGLKHSAALTWLELAVIRDSRIPSLFPGWLLAHDLITRGISVLLLSRLRAWREGKNLSQSEAAVKLQISKRTLQEWEQDRSAPRGFARTAIEEMIRP
jgi:DNA-binding XRE family transcriptional regulator